MTIWTDDLVEEVKRLWSVEGLSAAEIAKKLNLTSRNQVTGKLDRLGLLGTRATDIERARLRSLPAGERPLRKRTSYLDRIKHLAEIEKPVAPIEEPAPEPFRREDGKPYTFEDRPPKACAYPIGDPDDAAFCCCGHKTLPGLSYCERHQRDTHIPGSAKIINIAL